MKLKKESVGGGLDASKFKKYQRLTVTIGDGNLIDEEEITYDDGQKGMRLRVPVFHEGEGTNLSLGKTNKNRLIDALGDETAAWTGAELDLIVVEYASLGKQGFDIEAIRTPKVFTLPQKPVAATPTPAERTLKIIREMDMGKGAPVKSVSVALQAESGISAESVDAVVLALKNEGRITEAKNGMLKVVS